MRTLWERLLRMAGGYWYLRGVRDELHSSQELVRLLRDCRSKSDVQCTSVDIDLSHGIETAERQLDEERPGMAHVRYKKSLVGHLQPAPGAERLRGIHLRRALTRDLAADLLRALAREGIIDPVVDRAKLCQAIASLSRWLGRADPTDMWSEQSHQWTAVSLLKKGN